MTAATTFEKSKTLVGYLATAIAGAVAMAEAGAGVIEIGLPYSDPLMDGPVIADAVHQALTGGTRIKDVLDTVEAVAATGAQVLIMTYWNPVDHYGVHRFAADLANAGGAGLITRKRPATGSPPRMSMGWTGSSWSRRAQPRSGSSPSPPSAVASSTPLR
jgi:tryptophan synthase alpha chain